MTEVDLLTKALDLPSGARFYKCALQVNPFAYVQRHNRPTAFSDEASYNDAIVRACLDREIEIISVTDHYRIYSAERLIQAAKKAGIHVFPGFEAVTKDSVHLLCLFDPERPLDQIRSIIGECGIHDESEESPAGSLDAEEFLKKARSWKAVCIAAHVAADNGLLQVLQRQSRVNTWKLPELQACALPGPIDDAPENFRPILKNKNSEYHRARPIAVINAQDISSPEDFDKPGAYCFIKMSQVSVEGLRQAFLDPISRIRLASETKPEEHVELLSIAWEGGFLDRQAIHFNENLNILVGGRGTGKSTVIESLRYILNLDPIGEDAEKSHQGIVKQVLKNGTKVSLFIQSYRPKAARYRIDRTIPNPPVVRDEENNVLSISPRDLLPRVEIYGQHEISELAKSPEKQTRLLERFVEKDPVLVGRKNELRRELERSRTQILDIQKEIKDIDDRLDALPILEETLLRFQSAGYEEKLKEQSLLVREERVLKTMIDRIRPFHDLYEALSKELPIDRMFLSEKALEALPGKAILSPGNAIFEKLQANLESLIHKFSESLGQVDAEIASIRQHWDQRKNQVQKAYEKILRDLQKSSIDGEAFIQLRKQIEELTPLRDRQKILRRDMADLTQRRRTLMAEWEDLLGQEFRKLDRAAKKVSRSLVGRVRVQVSAAGDREPLLNLLREEIGGRLAETLEVLKTRSSLSPRELSEAFVQGKEALKNFGIPPAQAERLAETSTEIIMKIEELDLKSITSIELNISGEGQSEIWQRLDDLSTGQKATAILLLLLLESDSPLVIDQPEDDLDNRFITEGIVPKMREEKRRRQFIFSTHNANIPVLGDAELIVGLHAKGEPGTGQAEFRADVMGAMDSESVRNLIEEILEGGREAFETRRLKYGF